MTLAVREICTEICCHALHLQNNVRRQNKWTVL